MLSVPTAENILILADRLRDATAVTPALFRTVIATACRRFSSRGRSEEAARIERLIGVNAWTEAALALIELELSQWQLRRIAYDGGEWYCAVSRSRELPEWLDQSIEAHHTDLALALLSAFVEAQQLAAESSRPSVPSTRGTHYPLVATPCLFSTR